jgi:hypothetical protein
MTLNSMLFEQKKSFGGLDLTKIWKRHKKNLRPIILKLMEDRCPNANFTGFQEYLQSKSL